MPMLLIEGNYQALYAAPDGDSIRFYPNNPADWQRVPGPHQVTPNNGGGAQIRFDGIDALETHFTAAGSSSTVHQPLAFAHRAAQEVLEWLGFTGVVRAPDETVTACTPMRLPGYILTRTADKNGRCVAFVLKGQAPQPSGSSIYFSTALLRQSANYRMLKLGLAYPTYYTKLYPDIRNQMTKAVANARGGTGLWAEDATNSGFVLDSPETIIQDKVILPKLFRRLIEYLAINDGDNSLAGFESYLAARDDRLFILSTGHATGLDYVVKVTDQRVRMTRPPEDLVFVEG